MVINIQNLFEGKVDNDTYVFILKQLIVCIFRNFFQLLVKFMDKYYEEYYEYVKLNEEQC